MKLCRPAALLLPLVLVTLAGATPYRTPEEIAAEFARSGVGQEAPFQVPDGRRLPGTLDEREYFLHFRMLCDFLVDLQFTGPGVNRGGMIEGESGGDENIIQTDNTQEAIREWSQYAIWTGDTARYGNSIRLAQGYCQRFPAWREEGGGYYAAHNCGWGFEAVWKFREAYGDTSWNWYADSCAWWTQANPLYFDPNSIDLGQLNPLAEGLAIGGMYPHALYRGRTDWQNFTLLQARRLRTWFQSNPARLNANESWALCGGTALWGICNSLFTQYPDSGQTWLAQYGAQIDVWQSTGQWNHSFCTWYGNAQFAAWEITQDSMHWNNGVFICDSLIGLDTDDDGGIYPGRSSYSPANDHSWVSAYMGWMGMERIINSRPVCDAAVMEVLSPVPNLPHLAGDTLTLTLRVANAGVVDLDVRVTAAGRGYADTALVALAAGMDSLLVLERPWVVADDDSIDHFRRLVFRVSALNDENPDNDSLDVTFDIRGGADIDGLLFTGEQPVTLPVTGHVEFYHEAYPDSAWAEAEADENGMFTNGTRRLLSGNIRVHIVPEMPFMVTDYVINEPPNHSPIAWEFQIQPAQVVLYDDDAGADYERYYLSALDSLQVDARHWDVAADGFTELPTEATVLWFTGDDSTDCLAIEETMLLADFLLAGGRLILTGQNITDDEEVDLLEPLMHFTPRTADVSSRQVAGVAGQPISEGDTLFLIGMNGAGNQSSPASINVLPGATEILRYGQGNGEACGIMGETAGGRYVFLSFGLEGVSGVNNSTRRDEFLARAFAWLGDSLSDAQERPEALPDELALEPAYPNPFNPTTVIRFRTPQGVRDVELALYNLLGQRVRTLYSGSAQGGSVELRWDGLSDGGLPVASGVYLCRLSAGQHALVRSLRLVR